MNLRQFWRFLANNPGVFSLFYVCLVQQNREIDEYLQIPVIRVTSEVLVEGKFNDVADARSYRLTKPVDSNALFELLSSALSELEFPHRSLPTVCP